MIRAKHGNCFIVRKTVVSAPFSSHLYLHRYFTLRANALSALWIWTCTRSMCYHMVWEYNIIQDTLEHATVWFISHGRILWSLYLASQISMCAWCLMRIINWAYSLFLLSSPHPNFSFLEATGSQCLREPIGQPIFKRRDTISKQGSGAITYGGTCEII